VDYYGEHIRWGHLELSRSAECGLTTYKIIKKPNRIVFIMTGFENIV